MPPTDSDSRGEDLFAIQRRLYDQRSLCVAKIKKLVLAFLGDMQAVCAALEVLAPGFNELAFVVENHHRVVAFARAVHRVMHVDQALANLLQHHACCRT